MTTINAFIAALAEERALANTALVAALRAGDDSARRDALERLEDLREIADRTLSTPVAVTA
jgi:hypothetical protein